MVGRSLTSVARPKGYATGRRLFDSAHLLLFSASSCRCSSLPWTLVRSEDRGSAARDTHRPRNQLGHRSPYIGSVMALLATFEDAGVLPPEGTPQANSIIKAVIQFQSAFLKSHHPAVQQFFAEAHRLKFGNLAGEMEASFRQSGWSAESFDAVIEAGRTCERLEHHRARRRPTESSISASQISTFSHSCISRVPSPCPRRARRSMRSMPSVAGKCPAPHRSDRPAHIGMGGIDRTIIHDT